MATCTDRRRKQAAQRLKFYVWTNDDIEIRQYHHFIARCCAQ
jgi:hypothetical protein